MFVHHFQDIHYRNVRDGHLYRWSGSRPKCKYANPMPMNKIAIVAFSLSVTIFKIFAIEVCMTLTLIFRMDQANRKYAT